MCRRKLREVLPTSDAGEAGRKSAFTLGSAGSERVIQMQRWRLQVVMNVRGSEPLPPSPLTVNSQHQGKKRRCNIGPTAVDRGGRLKSIQARVRTAANLTQTLNLTLICLPPSKGSTAKIRDAPTSGRRQQTEKKN